MSSAPMPAPTSQLIRALETNLGRDRLLTLPEQMASYRGFAWLPARPRIPLVHPVGFPAAVVRTRTTDEVALVLREASAAGVPVVPYGGGTGVMGGVVPISDGIVLDLGEMNRVIAVERSNRVVRAEAGAMLEDVARAAEAEGLLFAHDPWSRPIATIGGAVSTSGVGYLAAGYGTFADQLRGLEVVLPTGEVLSWPGAEKTSVGPELWRLFVGAEGTLGVVTKVVAQLFPLPEAREFLAYRFPTFADGLRAIDQVVANGLRPVMIDYEEVEERPLEAPADLFLAFDGIAPVVAATTRRAAKICRANRGRSLGRTAGEEFWATRHESSQWFLSRPGAAPEALLEPPPPVGWRYIDVGVPIDRILDYCAGVVKIARDHGVRAHSFGLWGSPELLSYRLEGPQGRDRPGPLDLATDAALRLAREEGGTIEYCHGVGLRLAHLVPDELRESYDLLRRLKEMLDPAGILNPSRLALGIPAGLPAV